MMLVSSLVGLPQRPLRLPGWVPQAGTRPYVQCVGQEGLSERSEGTTIAVAGNPTQCPFIAQAGRAS